MSMETTPRLETTPRITLAWELHTQGLPKSRIAQRSGKDRGTIRLWIEAVSQQGLLPFLEQHQKAKKQPRPPRQVRLAAKTSNRYHAESVIMLRALSC